MSRKLTPQTRFEKALARAIELHIQDRDFFSDSTVKVEEKLPEKLNRAEKHLQRVANLITEPVNPNKFPAKNIAIQAACSAMCELNEVVILSCTFPEKTDYREYLEDSGLMQDITYVVRVEVPMTFVKNGGKCLIDYATKKDGSFIFLNE